MKRPNPLTQLAREFQAELRLQGLDTPHFRTVVARFEQTWRDGRPHGVEVPLVHSVGRYNPAVRAEGELSAREEWKRGEVALYVETRPPDLHVDLSRAIPYKSLPAKPDDPTLQRAVGHNAEIWRLLKEQGARKHPRFSWLPYVFDLQGTWQRQGYRALRLDRKHPGAIVPGSDQARLVWEPEPQDERERRMSLNRLPDGRLRAVPDRKPARQMLVLHDRWTPDVKMALWSFPPRVRRVDLLWGPTGSGVFLLRLRAPGDEEMPYRFYAMDMRTGAVLNAAAAEGDAE